MNLIRRYLKKRYLLLLLFFLLILKLFTSPPDSYNEDVGTLSVAVTNTTVFNYKTPAVGTLVFALKFPNKTNNTDANSDLGNNVVSRSERDNRRSLCARYGNELSTVEGSIRKYRCNTAFLSGVHKSKLYDEISGALLHEFDLPNGMDGFKLLVVNGIPKNRELRLEVQTFAFDDPNNVLATAIRKFATEPLPVIDVEKKAKVEAILKPWTRGIQGNVPKSVQKLTQ